VTVPKVMSAYTNHGKTTLLKRNSGWESTLSGRDHHKLRRVASKNHRIVAAQVRGELNIHLENPVSTKTVWCELHKSNTHSRAAIGKPQITESNAQMGKRWCHHHKTWKSDKWKRARYGQMSRLSRCFLHQEEFTFGEHPRKPPIRNAWFQQWNTGKVLCWFGQQYHGTVFCQTHCYPSWPNYCKGVRGQVG
jgi:hypothetical protein